MSKYTGPKVRISRKLGVPLTPKAAKVMERKPYPPGQHGPAKQFRRQRPSPYKQQLVEKQKLRAQYNIHEKQLRNYYKKATQKEGNTPDNLVGALETRLDNIVYRSGFARTIYQARQFVNHGHFQVDGKRVNIPSYAVKPGQVVALREKSRTMSAVEDAIAGAPGSPDYLSVNSDQRTTTLNSVPTYEQAQVFADVPKVVEFYSR